MSDNNDNTTGYVIARADWETDQAAIRGIRERVFVQEQGIPAELEWDAEDPNCAHFLAYDMDGNAIATARLKPDGQIGRMAVLPEWRDRGVGSDLLLSLIELAQEHRLETVYVHAQTSVAGFYHRHGFMSEGDPFEAAGIPHVLMTRYCTDPVDAPVLQV